MKSRRQKAEGRSGVALVVAIFVTIPLFAQTHPITFDDMNAIRRIGAPQVSPDGKWIAYDASTADMGANKRTSAIYLVPSAGGESRKIADGDGPAWSPDGKTIAYGAGGQVNLYDIAAGMSRKASDLPGGASKIKWVPDGSAVVATSDIYPQCGLDPACIKQVSAPNASSARIITSLLYRHWKAWQAPTRSHILYVPLNGGSARDLTPGPFDAPPFSVGGGDEFEVSPDSKELVFARNLSDHPEVSTNTDLYIVPLAGGDAKQITTRTGAD
ncbi:MAG TPA: S9 family peptidase, partial [Thermoanaerobaculia bacterium]|nr:S9 family peptidase [Thermoanaerobaculia bacterium]